jgi:hypothetical protein
MSEWQYDIVEGKGYTRKQKADDVIQPKENMWVFVPLPKGTFTQVSLIGFMLLVCAFVSTLKLGPYDMQTFYMIWGTFGAVHVMCHFGMNGAGYLVYSVPFFGALSLLFYWLLV